MRTLADYLYQKIEEGDNPARHTLDNGLTLTLKYNDAPGVRLWTLSLTRYCRQASDVEREKAKEAFHVPPDAGWTPDYKDGWGIIRYTWLEQKAQQMAFPGMGSDEDFNHYHWESKFD
jgi:hypothetical protein